MLGYLPTKELGLLYCYGLNQCLKGIFVEDLEPVFKYIVLKRLRRYLDVDRPDRQVSIGKRLNGWIKRLYLMETFEFKVSFDAHRKGDRVVLNSSHAARWAHHHHGSVYGHRACKLNVYSYWEIQGAGHYTFVGIAQDMKRNMAGFHPGAKYESTAYLSSNPGCNQVPGIMYSSAGFVTNGAFRGPKPQLPGSVRRLPAVEFSASDRVGVFVNLSEGYLLFLVNNNPQVYRIPLDRDKRYFPFVSDTTSDLLSLYSNVQPPWEAIFQPELSNDDFTA